MSSLRALALAAQGPHAPAYRIRMLLPSAELARLGVEVDAIPLFSLEEERRFQEQGLRGKAVVVRAARQRLSARLHQPAGTRAAEAAVWIQRQVDMLPTMHLERLAARRGRTVLDVDDAVWLDARPAAGGHPLAILKGSAWKMRRLAPLADHVLAGNEVLAEWLGQRNASLTIVPSLVEHRDHVVRVHDDEGPLVLGWIGSPTTERHLHGLQPVLARLARAGVDRQLELMVVGGTAPQVPGMACHSIRWSEATEREALQRMDIGLMPLADNAWTRGKCAYKALQYMAAGIPVVADDVGISATAVGDRQAGLIVRSPEQWLEALHALADSRSLRERLGAEGRRRVAERFSVERWAPVIAAALRGESPG